MIDSIINQLVNLCLNQWVLNPLIWMYADKW